MYSGYLLTKKTSCFVTSTRRCNLQSLSGGTEQTARFGDLEQTLSKKGSMLFQGQSTANPAVLVLTPEAFQGKLLCYILCMPINFTSTGIHVKTLALFQFSCLSPCCCPLGLAHPIALPLRSGDGCIKRGLLGMLVPE